MLRNAAFCLTGRGNGNRCLFLAAVVPKLDISVIEFDGTHILQTSGWSHTAGYTASVNHYRKAGQLQYCFLFRPGFASVLYVCLLNSDRTMDVGMAFLWSKSLAAMNNFSIAYVEYFLTCGYVLFLKLFFRCSNFNTRIISISKLYIQWLNMCVQCTWTGD